jgi:hypothetical protein
LAYYTLSDGGFYMALTAANGSRGRPAPGELSADAAGVVATCSRGQLAAEAADTDAGDARSTAITSAWLAASHPEAAAIHRAID